MPTRRKNKPKPDHTPVGGGRVRGLEKLKEHPDLPTGYLSATSLSMFYRCGLQWRFRYMDGLKQPPAVALIEGSSHHEGMHFNNAHKIKTGKDYATAKVVEKMSDEFSTRCKDVEDWGADSKDAVLTRGQYLIADYMARYAPTIKPTGAEEKFEIQLGDIPFIGFIDLRHKDGKIIADYKVTKAYWNEEMVETNLQFALYSEATGKRDVQVIAFRKGLKAPKVDIVSGVINSQTRAWVSFMARGLVAAVKKGMFLPAQPGKRYLCTPEYCGYWPICRQRYGEGK